jgi:hypothetical protein
MVILPFCCGMVLVTVVVSFPALIIRWVNGAPV